ncbi:MAG TPA: AbrB/MazE/SpoVT family DNA-binding domain-containing protein [Rhizobiaceae bacterium]|nr:AbrB/MazE/SpoVT family DNA-binding domain-containing protein [Rhizobiaceae bacterium]
MTATAKLFMNGRSQAVRLPAEFRFEGTEVNVRRDPATGGVLLTPKPERTGSWDRFLKALEEIDPRELEDFMEDRDQGTQERDLF